MPASCDKCDPAQRIDYGCDGYAENGWIDILDDKQYDICPIKIISDSVFDWYGEYSYYVRYPGSAPKYTDIMAKYIDGLYEYEKAYKVFETIANGKTIRK